MTGDGAVIITGAGGGIGAATARLLAADGRPVCLGYNVAADVAERLADEIAAIGGRAMAVKCDVTSDAGVEAAFAAAADAYGSIAGLVAAAGMSGGRKAVAEMSLAEFEAVHRVNVLGTFLCCREALRRMSTSAGGGGGAIVIVSSQAAQFGGSLLSHYASSKAALNAFAIGFAREAAPLGVRVNAVSPGIIDTPFHGALSAEQRAGRAAGIPLGRMGDAAEVAEAILWLMSEKAGYVTGAVLPVAGGR